MAKRAAGPITVEPPIEADAFPLASTPGFHSLDGTRLVGLIGSTHVVLEVYCACDEKPMARVRMRLDGSREVPHEGQCFVFAELGQGEIGVTPALDATAAGHFRTTDVWITRPDGWQQIGGVDARRRKLTRSRVKALEIAARPSAFVAEVAKGSEAKCACGHLVGKHDPCSECECPQFHTSKKLERYARRKA